MLRRKRDYLKIYKKHIDTESTLEKDMFNDFKNMYLQKLDDSNFDINVEKCKLLLGTDSRIDSAFSLYCSGIASVGIALFGIYFSINQSNPLATLTYIVVLIIIAAYLTFGAFIIVKNSICSDVYNIALIALDAAIKEKPRK